jgi:SAM-dependent methyltransferase
MSAADEGDRFGGPRPEHLRNPPPAHPFRHIVLRLRAVVGRLIRRLELGQGDRVLDFGSAEMPYRDLFPGGVELIGADLPGNPDATLEIAADGTLPAADASFDAVLSTQVLEHVEDPALYLSECRRVLRPGGRLLLSTHGIMIYHPDPVDLWRWTPAGLERIVADAGLEVIHLEGIMGLTATGAQLFQDGVIYRISKPRARRAFGRLMQGLIAWLDRRERPAAARDNALVFALIAQRPAADGSEQPT